MAFGKLLEQKMEERNVKQAELAAAIGIPKSTLSCIISRDNTKIEIELFLKICKFLDCNPEEFYNEYSENEQKQLPPSFVVKYNSLDTHGKLAVDSILNIEYDRCITANSKTSELHIAAVNGITATMTDDAEKIHNDVQALIKKHELPK